MDYKRQIKIDKNFISVYVLAISVILAGMACLAWWSKAIGFVCLATGIFICWTIAKTIKTIHNSRITTYTEGFSVVNADSSKMSINWDEITMAGKVEAGKFSGHVFVYAENSDKYIQLSPVFSDFDKFEDELKYHVDVKSILLQEDETVRDYIKKQIS